MPNNPHCSVAVVEHYHCTPSQFHAIPSSIVYCSCRRPRQAGVHRHVHTVRPGHPRERRLDCSGRGDAASTAGVAAVLSVRAHVGLQPRTAGCQHGPAPLLLHVLRWQHPKGEVQPRLWVETTLWYKIQMLGFTVGDLLGALSSMRYSLGTLTLLPIQCTRTLPLVCVCGHLVVDTDLQQHSLCGCPDILLQYARHSSCLLHQHGSILIHLSTVSCHQILHANPAT